MNQKSLCSRRGNKGSPPNLRKYTLYVYPLDNDSIIIRYEPRNGIKSTYLKSGFGDFNRILEVIYELTGSEVFNESVEYQ